MCKRTNEVSSEIWYISDHTEVKVGEENNITPVRWETAMIANTAYHFEYPFEV